MLIHRFNSSINRRVFPGSVGRQTQLHRIDIWPGCIAPEILGIEEHPLQHRLQTQSVQMPVFVQPMTLTLDTIQQSSSLVHPSLQSARRNVRQQSIVVVQAQHDSLAGIQLEDMVEDLLL